MTFEGDDASVPPFQVFTVARMEQVQGFPLFICFILGFALSLLFLMDQNISAAMVDSPSHKLTKGKLPYFDSCSYMRAQPKIPLTSEGIR